MDATQHASHAELTAAPTIYMGVWEVFPFILATCAVGWMLGLGDLLPFLPLVIWFVASIIMVCCCLRSLKTGCGNTRQFVVSQRMFFFLLYALYATMTDVGGVLIVPFVIFIVEWFKVRAHKQKPFASEGRKCQDKKSKPRPRWWDDRNALEEYWEDPSNNYGHGHGKRSINYGD